MSEKAVDSRIAYDPITETLFHRVMLLFNKPVGWSDWVMGLAILLLAILTGGFLLLLGASWRFALLVAITQLFFFANDSLLLVLLPRWRISFGPWKAQFFPLALPRALSTMGLALLGLFIEWETVFLLIVAVQIVGSCALVWGAIIEPRRLRIAELDIDLNLPTKDGDPIHILHISDLHIEQISRREDDILVIIERVQPDLILLTGDYINLSYNEDPVAYRQVREFLERLHAAYGVYASLGTLAVDRREFVVPIFDDLHVDLLRDTYKLVTLGDKGQVALIGIDCTHDMVHDAAVLQSVAQNIPPSVPKVLLYHSPELMPQAVNLGIDIYLCGHTHGGQVRLPIVGPIMTGSQLGRRYVLGYYEEAGTKLYISPGVGFEGLSAPRVRLLARPEVTEIRVRGERQ